MKIILFEDQKVDNLYPITLTRPSFDILSGGLTLREALKVSFPQDDFDFFVRPYLQETSAANIEDSNAGDDKVLLINGKIAPSLETLKQIKEKTKSNKDFILKKNNSILAVFSADLSIYVKFTSDNLPNYLEGLNLPSENFECQTFDNLWDIIKFNKENLKTNLEILSESYTKKGDGIYLAGNMQAAENAVFDASEGPIVIDEDVKIEPFVELKGPLFIGKSTVVRSFTKLYMSSIGPVSRVGGEVVDSVIQGYSNKQHQGFLGNSYVGEWVNIGGGSSNSDLKNTYGYVKMNNTSTNEQFMGCVIGDYSKIGINTSIATGKIIGVSSFIYGDVLHDVPSFSNLLPNNKFVEVILEIAQKVQKIARLRREMETKEADRKLLSDIFTMTKHDRRKSKVKKGKLNFK